MSVNDPRPQTCPGAASCHAGQTAPHAGTAAAPRRWTRLGAARDVPAGGLKTFSAGGVTVLVVRVGDQLTAVQPLCPHEAIPLEQGQIEGATLTCLEHMWQFDVKSGAPLGEATEGLQTYPLRDEAGELYVALE